MDVGLRITVTCSSNEIGTDVSSSTLPSTELTVRFVSKLSALGARHVFCWTVNYRKNLSAALHFWKMFTTQICDQDPKLIFLLRYFPSHFTTFNLLFALDLFAFCAIVAHEKDLHSSSMKGNTCHYVII